MKNNNAKSVIVEQLDAEIVKLDNINSALAVAAAWLKDFAEGLENSEERREINKVSGAMEFINESLYSSVTVVSNLSEMFAKVGVANE